MDVTLTDWLGTHLGLLWLLIGVMLLTLEWLRRDLTMAMLAIGPAVAAGVAIVAPHAWYAQLVIGLVAALASAVVVRPALLRGQHRRRAEPPA